jgi:hypothetical protein
MDRERERDLGVITSPSPSPCLHSSHSQASALLSDERESCRTLFSTENIHFFLHVTRNLDCKILDSGVDRGMTQFNRII